MFIYRIGMIMKRHIIQFKKFKIDAYIQKVHYGFEFAPIKICKFRIINNYIKEIIKLFLNLELLLKHIIQIIIFVINMEN